MDQATDTALPRLDAAARASDGVSMLGIVTTTSEHRPMLGALAGRAGLGETFATEALGVVLQHPRLRAAALRYLETASGADLTSVTHLLTEVDHQEYGRTDIEGQDASGRPRLIIEAKFGASLTANQVGRYLALQADTCMGQPSALVLLMPGSRVEDAQLLLRRALNTLPHHAPATVCLSWDQILGILSDALGDADRGARSIEADLIQLAALVEARTRIVLHPLGVAAAGESWQTRRAELVALVDAATQQLADTLNVQRGPQVGRRDITFAPSYYLKAAGPVPGTFFSIGLHSGVASEGLTPMWMRFNKRTGDGLAVKRIREYLGDEPQYASRLRLDRGKLWVPVDLDPLLADEALVESVVRQILAILIAAKAESAELLVRPA